MSKQKDLGSYLLDVNGKVNPNKEVEVRDIYEFWKAGLPVAVAVHAINSKPNERTVSGNS